MARSTINDVVKSAAGTVAHALKIAKRLNIDIYIREKSGSREIRIPWLPEKIEYQSGGAEVVSYSIMNKGPVEIPTGSGLKEVSWESEFPGQLRTDDSMLRGTWQEVAAYHNILEDWKVKGTPLNIMVTGYPINFDGYLSEYDGTSTGGFGDFSYRLKLKERRDITITTTVEKKNSGTSGTTTKRPAAETTSYTIKKGDCLWNIALKFLGSGTKWPTIYKANKAIIESTAKKYGHKSSNNGWWIFPGTKITIPK